jgi:adenylate cyclase
MKEGAVKDLLKKIFKLTGFRLSLLVAFVFMLAHVLLENRYFKTGFFAKDGFFARLEYAALDAKFLARSEPFDNRVIVAAADERSLERYGLWPWNRARLAELIDGLTAADVKVIGFDVVFADEDKNSTFRELTRFKDIYDESGLYRKVQPALLGQISDRVSGALATTQDIQATASQKRKLQQVEQELKSVEQSIGSYEEKSQRFYVSPDEALAQSIRKSKRVVSGYFAFTDASETIGLSEAKLKQNFEAIKRAGTKEIYAEVNGPVSKLANEDWTVEKLPVRKAVGVQSPLPIIAEASEYFGLFNVTPDPDKIIRSVPMFYQLNGLLLPSLSLQSAAAYSGGGFQSFASPVYDSSLGGVYLNDAHLREGGQPTFIPTDRDGSMLINYYADPAKTIPTYSIVDIIEKKVDLAALKDKVVLVGVTAIGTFDLRSNPYSVSPGIYIQAAATQNILDRRFLERFQGLAVIEGIGLLFLAIVAGLVLPRIRISLGLVMVVGIVAALIVIDFLFIFKNGILIRLVLPMLMLAFIFVGVTIFRFLTEEREKRAIRKAFQFYLSKSVVDSVLNDTSKLKLGGEKRDMSVMFSDIRGFTTLSERLSPEELVHLLNDYLTPMTDIVFAREGTLDKYMGDAIMSFWGAPVDQPDHATKACVTALDMMLKLKDLQMEWRAKNLPEIDIGIGINSGAMAVGNMGSSQRFDYTVMGDNVNLASRLEGINKEYGTNIIISEFTYLAAKKDVYVRQVDSVRVKGKHEPVHIYELRGLGRPQGMEEQFILAFEKGIALYKAQQWDDAITSFQHCLEMMPLDYCSKKYIDRCTSMKEEPPGPSWDGVYTMKTK